MKINKNFLVVSNYNNDISWVKEYTDNFIIYDRSDEPIDPEKFDGKVIRQKNIGYNLYDYFTFIIDHYDALPECIIFAKGNIFPRHISREYFETVMNNNHFTPLEDTKYLDDRWPIGFYKAEGGYRELNNSWYIKHFKTRYFKSYTEFLKFCFKNPTIPTYIPFAPGANYIVPKENILRLPKKFYENLRLLISYTQLPGEAHIIERALYTIWTSNAEIREELLSNLEEKALIQYSTLYKINLGDTLRTLYGKIGNIYHYIMKTKSLLKLGLTYTKNFIYICRQPFEKIAEHHAKKAWLSPVEITEYRKKIKIYDIFTYNGEADILEIRLAILSKVVDEFIIIEAPTTFSGIKKPLYFELQKERFTQFTEKIKYYVIDDYPNDEEICKLADNNSNVPKHGPEHWKREFYQKESIKKAITHLSPNDICFIGDVDEIWNPEIIIDYSKDAIFKLRQTVYSYFLNNQSNEPWAGTMVTKYKNIKNACLNDLRTPSKTNYVYLSNGGWHFTSMGGLTEVRRKLNDSYTTESYNTSEVQNSLEKRFGKSDYMGRGFTFTINEQTLPPYLKNNKNKYQHLFKSNSVS